MIVTTEAVFPPSLPTDEYQNALAISPSIERVDSSVLRLIEQVFPPNDRRTINGIQFLAHFLRLAQIKQLALFPDCDVAIINVKSVQTLSTDPAYAWPFSYEATSKYLRLLCAIGLFSKQPRRKYDPVVYYFPLRPFHAENTATLSQLTHANKKVSKSIALQRLTDTLQQDNNHSTKAKRQITDSSYPEFTRRLQIAALAVCDTLHEKGFTIPTAILQQIIQVILHTFENTRDEEDKKIRIANFQHTESAIKTPLPEHYTCVTKSEDIKESTTFPKNLPSGQKVAVSLANQQEKSHKKQRKQKKIADLKDDRSTMRLQSPKLHFHQIEPENTKKSAISSMNLRYLGMMADSSNSSTEFSISNTILTQDNTTEFSELRQNQTITHNGREKTNTFPEGNMLDVEQIRHDACELSYLFETDDSSVGHYTQLLRENPQATRLAVIDAWMRSKWPDKGFKTMKLGGGWVTKRFYAYSAGEVAPAEFHAWAQTDYDYTQIIMTLDAIDQYQQQEYRPSERPFPSEAIMPAEEIAGPLFWEYGAISDLKVRGYLYVDVEGDLLSLSQYEQLRFQAVEQWSRDLVLITPDCLEDITYQETIEYAYQEVHAYLSWVQPQVCTPKKISQACPLPEHLVDDIRSIEMVVDSSHQVRPFLVPLTRKLMIHVSGPQHNQWLVGPNDVQTFLNLASFPGGKLPCFPSSQVRIPDC